MCGRYIIQT